MPSAAAALNQRLLFFKIPYLAGYRGAYRSCNVNKSMAFAALPDLPQRIFRNGLLQCI